MRFPASIVLQRTVTTIARAVINLVQFNGIQFFTHTIRVFDLIQLDLFNFRRRSENSKIRFQFAIGLSCTEFENEDGPANIARANLRKQRAIDETTKD